MKNEIFFIASPDVILPVNKVKAMMDYEADVSKKIVKNQIEKNVRNICRKNQQRRCVIWMDNNTFYLTSVSVDTIYNRCIQTGRKFIKVGRGLYLPVDIIEGVFAFDSTLAAKIRKESELLQTKFNFVRTPKPSSKTILKNKLLEEESLNNDDDSEEVQKQKEQCGNKKKTKTTPKRNSTILLTSGENISTVYTPEVIVARACNVSPSK